MKKIIHKLIELTYTLSAGNTATLRVTGEVPTSGWTEPQLDHPRIGDGVLHLDFVALPPTGNTLQVFTPISTKHVLPLGPQPQEVTVHSSTNEMSVTLPLGGDPA